MKFIGISKRLRFHDCSIRSHVFREIADRVSFHSDGGGGEGEAGGGSGVDAGGMIHEVGGEAGVVLDLLVGEVAGELVYDGGNHLHVAEFFGTCIAVTVEHGEGKPWGTRG